MAWSEREARALCTVTSLSFTNLCAGSCCVQYAMTLSDRCWSLTVGVVHGAWEAHPRGPFLQVGPGM